MISAPSHRKTPISSAINTRITDPTTPSLPPRPSIGDHTHTNTPLTPRNGTKSLCKSQPILTKFRKDPSQGQEIILRQDSKEAPKSQPIDTQIPISPNKISNKQKRCILEATTPSNPFPTATNQTVDPSATTKTEG